jgi:hypothetical protein
MKSMGEPVESNAREFYVHTSFQKAACRPGGLPRDMALRNADANIERIKPGFALWLDKEMAELLRSLPEMKSTAASHPSWIDQVEQFSSNLIDVAGTMGYPFISFVAGNLQKICEAARSGAVCHGEVVTCHIDALFLGKRQNYLSLRPDDLPELSAGLRRIIEPKHLQQPVAG